MELASPDGAVRLEIDAAGGRLTFAIGRAGTPAIARSDLGLIVDGVNLGRGAAIGAAEPYRVNERYPMRGGHSEAVARCNGVRIRPVTRNPAWPTPSRPAPSTTAWPSASSCPEAGRPRVVNEATTFRLVPGSTVWSHDLHGHYRGSPREERGRGPEGRRVGGAPLTIRLPDGRGYAAITEASLGGFAGMALQADGRLGLAGHGSGTPIRRPTLLLLRYKDDVDRLTRPAALNGAITTPWRVVMVAADLNALVNCDIVGHVSPPPDPALFPEGAATGWVKPGRAVWRFLDGGPTTLEGMKEFSRLAGELGFEYNVLEGFWRRWSDDQLRELVRDSKSHGVGIWLWIHSKELRTPEARRAFFEKCRDVGAVGAKIDFFDHEAKEVVNLYPELLREAARSRILVNFHGANKPTGESRTWPNELGARGRLRPGAQGDEGVGPAQRDAPLHPPPRRPGGLHAGALRRTSPRDVVGAPGRERSGPVVALAGLRRPSAGPADEPRRGDDQEHPERLG